MASKKDLKIWIPVLLATAVAIILIKIEEAKVDSLLSLKQTYVIGTVVEKRYPTRGDPIIDYRYQFYGRNYKQSSNGFRVNVGERYFISIPEGHEDQGIILLDKPVPDHIKTTPNGGWEELPVE